MELLLHWAYYLLMITVFIVMKKRKLNHIFHTNTSWISISWETFADQKLDTTNYLWYDIKTKIEHQI